MLKLFIFLINLYYILWTNNAHAAEKSASENSRIKTPIVFYSNKVTIDKVLNQIIYEGNVVVEFEEYDIITSKIIFNMHKKDGKNQLKFAECPDTTKIVKRDLSEVAYAPNATFDAETKKIVSTGEVLLQKDEHLVSSNYLEIQLKESDDLKNLGIKNEKK